MNWPPADASRTELRRIIAELASERDAAKRDTLLAWAERDRAIDEAAYWKGLHPASNGCNIKTCPLPPANPKEAA